jgi:TolB-like protein/Flp pilus assembly protein TadD
MSRLKQFVTEIHRRSLWQVLGIYVVGAWIAFQVVQTLTEGLGLPEWFPGIALGLLIVLLPVVLATAFVQEGVRGPRRPEAAEPAVREAPRAHQRVFTWRNAGLGVVIALGMWGVVATGWLLFRSTPDEAGGEAALGRKMLVVLPFENLGAPEDEYFADGMTEEIVSRLAELPGLGIISRTSAMQYKGSEKSIRQIGEELNVEYVLEGTVRWEHPADGPSRVRITPQLVRVSDDTHLWTERYDAVLASVFQIQSDVAQRVAEALDLTLLERRGERGESGTTADLEAYQYYLRGNDYLSRGFTEADTRIAVELYERAVQQDPDFAHAQAMLSRAHSRMYHFFYDSSEQRMELARQAMERAVQLRPDLPEARFAQGDFYYRLRDYERALEELAIAETLWPASGEVAYSRGSAFRRKGDWELAVEEYRRSARFDPRSAENSHSVGSTLLYTRNYAESETYLDRAISLQPDWPQPRLYKAWLQLLASGDTVTARTILEAAIENISPSPLVSSVDDVQPWMMLRCLVYDGVAVGGLGLGFFGVDTASYYLYQAESHELTGEQALAAAYYDSVRVMMERKIALRPGEARNHSLLGVAYAGLGRKNEAVQEATRATELLSVSEDALWGRALRENLAWVHAKVGEYDAAIQELEGLLAIPGLVSVPLLSIDPFWDPLRSHPRFQALLERYE